MAVACLVIYNDKLLLLIRAPMSHVVVHSIHVDRTL